MIKINIVCVGRVKEKYFADGISEYVKRISKYATVSITELQEENYNNVTESLISTIKQKEAERILPHLKGYVFAMAIEGKKFSSENFAKKIKGLMDAGEGVITFVIGGSYGLDDNLKQKANELISFSDMTFPHTLFRVLILEQLYRAFSILNDGKYHK
jgi:23S rRNA (pseudouridine1915-N3)-methyltransferase